MSLTTTDLQKIEDIVEEKLQNHPTRDEFAQLMQMIDGRFKKQDEKWEERFKSVPTRVEMNQRFAEMQAQIKGLPTREEFFSRMDALMYEVQEKRTEQVALSHRADKHDVQIKNHSARIKKVEKRLHLSA